MATLTIDLDRISDVEFALEQLNRIAPRLRVARTPPPVEVAAPNTLDDAARDLLNTRTGQILIEPFVRRFTGDASFEQISEILEPEAGVDPVRKVHSLFAGLGRWELPRNLKVFEATADRPPRYRMNADIRAAIERVLVEREAGEENAEET